MDWKDIPPIIMALGVLVSAVLSGLAALYAARAKFLSEENTIRTKTIKAAVQDIKEDMTGVKTNILTVEKATNSMKDALVEATRSAAFSAGQAEERTNPEQRRSIPPT